MSVRQWRINQNVGCTKSNVGCQRKDHYLVWDHSPSRTVRGALVAPKTIQAVAIVLSHVPKFNDKTLLLKLPHTFHRIERNQVGTDPEASSSLPGSHSTGMCYVGCLEGKNISSLT